MMEIPKFKIPTEEEFEEILKSNYKDHKQNKNNFSYWYKKVKDCGIKMVNCHIYQIPFSQYKNSHSDEKTKVKKFEKYIEKIIKDLPYKMYNIKNGTYSDKFNFVNCMALKSEIPQKINLINYSSAIVGAGGYTELVVRDVINYDYETIPTIYNGMPLRSEFRVFYDFDKRNILYSVNYWDFDYCYNHLNITDKIIFEHERDRLETNFINRKEEVENLVDYHMKNVKMKGKWSIDILYNELEDTYYLIDMALAHRSAYWR